MKRKYMIAAIVAVLVVIGIGGYAAMNKYLGNNIEVESVINSAEGDSSNSEAASKEEVIAADELNGEWAIASGAKVYWSVTTSKETVNFVNEGVNGKWNIDVNNAAVMTGEGTVDMNALNSGNNQRDSHVKERPDLLAVGQYPEATFVTKSFSEIPKEWKEGTPVPLTIEGTLKVKGKEKDVKFESQVIYKGGQLLLSGETKVTFADFGMQSPHTVVLETENELSVKLELVLDKE